jgi:hypothetical protein
MIDRIGNGAHFGEGVADDPGAQGGLLPECSDNSRDSRAWSLMWSMETESCSMAAAMADADSDWASASTRVSLAVALRPLALPAGPDLVADRGDQFVQVVAHHRQVDDQAAQFVVAGGGRGCSMLPAAMASATRLPASTDGAGG